VKNVRALTEPPRLDEPSIVKKSQARNTSLLADEAERIAIMKAKKRQSDVINNMRQTIENTVPDGDYDMCSTTPRASYESIRVRPICYS
jgi:hypothetical protein